MNPSIPTPQSRSEEFLKLSEHFRLGELITESSHPVTTNLSETAKRSIPDTLRLLFDVDKDVLKTYQRFTDSGRARPILDCLLRSIAQGGKIFFTGCGSTGRLSIQLVSLWRDFWQRQAALNPALRDRARHLEDRAFAVMAGGDFALIKAVEGFEDFTAFGKKQLEELGVSSSDVVFAITEGGETSFVIGTAWKGLEAGAKVYFVYNNPDDVLHPVQRSREIIEASGIEKINLTTGPMAITGSTRMQATSVQLAVMVTILEMVLAEILKEWGVQNPPPPNPNESCSMLVQMVAALSSPEVLAPLSSLVSMEESIYRVGGRVNYLANRFGVDVLTDTTERSPTYCTPPFRKFDDTTASESWAFLFVPHPTTEQAWEHILKRKPQCLEWTEAGVADLVDSQKLPRILESLKRITRPELMRFKIGLDGFSCRPLRKGDGLVAIIAEEEKDWLLKPDGFYRTQLESAHKAGAKIGFVFFGREAARRELQDFLAAWKLDVSAVLVPVPEPASLLDGATRFGVKLLLNALSTCTMVRLGRVMGNYMIYVVPSNLKLIDRSTRYIQKLAGLDYPSANRLLFEVIDYVEPRMRADQAYPPVVGLAVTRARHGLTNEAAESLLNRS